MTTRTFTLPCGLTCEEMARLEERDPMMAAAYRAGRIIDGDAWLRADAEQDRLTREYEALEASEFWAEMLSDCEVD